MVQVNWTFQAKGDLRTIADYISKDSKRHAKYQVLRIKNRTRILKTQSRSGKVVLEMSRDDIRDLIEGNYRIIYKIVENNRIDILTIHHSSRDLTRRRID